MQSIQELRQRIEDMQARIEDLARKFPAGPLFCGVHEELVQRLKAIAAGNFGDVAEDRKALVEAARQQALWQEFRDLRREAVIAFSEGRKYTDATEVRG